MTDVMPGIGAIFKAGTADNPYDYITLGRVITLSGPQLTAERIDITALDSAGGYKEYGSSLKDGGEVTIECYWKGTDAAQDNLRAAIETRAVFPCKIEWPDDEASAAAFDATMVSATWNTTANEGVKCTFVLKTTGQILWDEAALGYYIGHRAVLFDGTTPDFLSRAAATLPAAGYLTFAMKFRTASTASQRLIEAWSAGGDSFIISRTNTSSGNLSVTAKNAASTIGTNGNNLSNYGSEQLAPGVWRTVHVALSKDGGGTIRYWFDGVEKTQIAWTIAAGDIPLNLMDNVRIGRSSTDTLPFNGDIAFVWMAAGATSAYAITDPTKFFDGGDVNLGPTGATPGVVPQIFFGGTQGANDSAGDPAKGWNDGYNQGTGGNFTMNGGV